MGQRGLNVNLEKGSCSDEKGLANASVGLAGRNNPNDQRFNTEHLIIQFHHVVARDIDETRQTLRNNLTPARLIVCVVMLLDSLFTPAYSALLRSICPDPAPAPVKSRAK